MAHYTDPNYGFSAKLPDAAPALRPFSRPSLSNQLRAHDQQSESPASMDPGQEKEVASKDCARLDVPGVVTPFSLKSSEAVVCALKDLPMANDVAPFAASRPQRSVMLHDLDRSLFHKGNSTPKDLRTCCERHRRSMRDLSKRPPPSVKHSDRGTALTEVMPYIRSLRVSLEDLQCKKSDISAHLGLHTEHLSGSSSRHGKCQPLDEVSIIERNNDLASKSSCHIGQSVEVEVRFSGTDVVATLSTPKLRGLWTAILMLLQEYSVEVVNAKTTTIGVTCFHFFRAKANSLTRVESVDLKKELEALIEKLLPGRQTGL